MKPENQVDVVILTALTEERDAVLRYVDKQEEVSSKGRVFHRVTIGKYHVVVLCMQGMGNVRSAAATQQAIAVWNPANIVLLGISGGIKKASARVLGDVLVAEQVVDYESGKVSPDGMQHRYQVYRPTKELLDAALSLPAEKWALSIKTPRPDGQLNRIIPQAHFGVLASGQKVVTAPDLVDELKGDWAELIGIEMESIGVALAAYESEQAPGFLVIKGISDWADPTKSDGWHTYAAEASAAFTVALLKSSPFESHQRPQVQRAYAAKVYPGKLKVSICRKLHNDWKDLADTFDIPHHQQVRFEKGDEPRCIWDWLSDRGKLGELPDALRFIERADLAEELERNPDPQ